jgi:type I restriction enzyme S subunit
VRDGWLTKSLGDVSDVLTGPFGSLLHKSDYVSDGIPLINPINIVDGRIVVGTEKTVNQKTLDRLRNYVLTEGDIIFGRRGEIGRCAVIGPDQSGWLCGTGCFFIKRSTQVDSRFLAELLGAPPYRQQLEAAATGTTMKNLSNQALQNLSVSFPPLSEQQRIVAILDEAFAGLATATANAEKNLKNARELFESYVNSILMDQASKPAAHTMLSICELIVDCEHKTAPTQPEGVASIRTPNIGKGELILEGVNRVSEETFQIWSRRAVPQAGDLIFAREAMAGNVAVIPPNLRCVLGQRTVLIRPKTLPGAGVQPHHRDRRTRALSR